MSGPMARRRTGCPGGKPLRPMRTLRGIRVPGMETISSGTRTMIRPGLMTEPMQVIGQPLPAKTDKVHFTTAPTGWPLVGRQSWIGMLTHENGGMTTTPAGVGIGIGPLATQLTGCGSGVSLQMRASTVT